MRYDLYTTTDGGATGTLVAANINTGYEYPFTGTADFFIKSINSIGTSLNSNINEGTSLNILSVSWAAQTADVLFNFAGTAGSSMEFTNNGGTTWTTIAMGATTITTSTGPYEVRENIGGGVNRCNFDNSTSMNLTGSIVIAGGELTSTSGMFWDCSNVTTINVNNLNTENIITMDNMFNGCSSITTLDVSNWDTTNVTNTNAMFSGCTELNLGDLSSLNGDNITNMGNMFANCTKLTNVSLRNSLGNLTNTNRMFVTCNSLETVDFTNFDMSNVIDNEAMFGACPLLICITNLNTTGSSNKTDMFENCTALVQPDAAAQIDITDTDGADWVNPGTCRSYPPINIPLTLTWETQTSDTQVVIDGSMDYSNDNGVTWNEITNGINTLPSGAGPYILKETAILGEVNTCLLQLAENFGGAMVVKGGGNLVTGNKMFYDLKNITSLDISQLNTSKMLGMEQMFSNLQLVTSLNLFSFDTSLVNNMRNMFSGCLSLVELDLSTFSLNNIIYFTGLFSGCESLVTLTENFDTSIINDMGSIFSNCYNLKNFDISNWDTSNVTNLSSMFQEARSITDTAYMDSWDISKVTSLNSMFKGCTSLTTIDSTNWGLVESVNMNSMFEGCTNITSGIFASGINNNLTSTTNSFKDCSSLISLDLTGLILSSGWARYMFQGCSNLVCISNINTVGLQIGEYPKEDMFENCTALVQPDAAAQIDITDTDGADWVNPGTCP